MGGVSKRKGKEFEDAISFEDTLYNSLLNYIFKTLFVEGQTLTSVTNFRIEYHDCPEAPTSIFA